MGRRKSPWCLGPILGQTLPYPLIPPPEPQEPPAAPPSADSLVASLQERQAMRLSSGASRTGVRRGRLGPAPPERVNAVIVVGQRVGDQPGGETFSISGS